MGNYLPKNSKTQYRKQTRHLLIIVNKESPTFRWGSLQLTTYEVNKTQQHADYECCKMKSYCIL